MSIDRTQKISPASLPEIHQEMAKRASKSPVQNSLRASSARSGTRVSLSNQVDDLKADDTQDINYARLEKIKSALAAGALPIDTDKIAQSLLQDMIQPF